MHAIWHSLDIGLDTLEEKGKNTMNDLLGIEFTEIGKDYLRAKMPVNDKTRQAYGILHGGASAALAETLGSIASSLVLNPDTHYCVGMEINANHIRSVSEGYVHGIASPLHLGRQSHVWDIRIADDQGKLVCVSRLTVAILKKK
ncbi:MAG: hotdog fold thioesterase [Chitinophagaceae bacterium]